MASNAVTKVTDQRYLAIDRAAVSAASSWMAKSSPSPAEACNTDLRVCVSPSMYTYPDLTIVCGKPLAADGRQDTLLNPTVIFEVLSPSTEYYDRGLKFRRYREIETRPTSIASGWTRPS